jgi:flavin-binding protein dodecin
MLEVRHTVPLLNIKGVGNMSVYKVIELVGTSSESWEKAAEEAVATASKSLKDLRIAEVVELDMQIEDGKVKAYRTKVKVSFKYHGKD